jgi:hypothetical protein
MTGREAAFNANKHPMNEVEARLALVRHLESYRSRSHAYLATAACIGRSDKVRVAVAGGARYLIDVQVVWENVSEGKVKVIASIIDGATRPEGPITEEFIVQPAGDSVPPQPA